MQPVPAVGESIELSLSHRGLLLGAAAAYGMPLAGMMSALLLGTLLGESNDVITALLASFGFVSGALAGRVLARRWRLRTQVKWRGCAS